MDAIELNPERRAALVKFAHEHGQAPAEALDAAVASYLQWQTLEEDVIAIEEALSDHAAGRSVSLEEFDAHMRRKYAIPG